MNKDELLKIYSDYLLCDLQVQHILNGKFGKVIGIDTHKHELSVCFDSEIWQGVDVRVLKPVLYDISYLTKEIEHDGETFVPIVKWADLPAFAKVKSMGYSSKHYFVHFEIENEILEYKIPADLNSMNYYTVQSLLKWHFNIFNLPESEYINKATLTKKQ